MNEPAHSSDDSTARYTTSPLDREPPSPSLLTSIVVRYENQSDRCTLTPSECSNEAKLTTWLTANLDAFVDLEAAR